MSARRRDRRLHALATALHFHPDVPVEELVPLDAPPPSRFLEVEGVRAHCRDEGRGPALLLLHGTSSSLHTWDGWTAELSGTFRILRVDLPGFGLTGPDPCHDYTLPRYVRFVAALLEALEVEGAIHLAGSSLGGEIAAAFALTHPRRVDRLVLVDAGGYPRSLKLPPAMRLAKVPGLGRLLTVWTPRFLVTRSAASAYGDPRRLAPEVAQRYFRLLLRRGNRQALVARLRTPPLDPPLAIERITAPTLILWGSKDRWIPVSDAHRFHADITGSKLVVYPDAGHVPMEELPAETAGEVKRFLIEGLSPTSISAPGAIR